MPPVYLDFHLDIGPDQNGLHEILARSPAGEERAFARFPLIDKDLELYLTKLENAILRSKNRSRRVLTPEEEAVQTFGRHLFDFLFAEEIRPLFRRCQTLADTQQAGVRLKLNIRTPYLAALPWEFLFDASRRDYFCLDPNTPVVRTHELAQPLAPLHVAAPLRILGMIAQPSDYAELDIAHEKQRMEAALAPLQNAGHLELTWVEGQSNLDLQRAMRRGTWHIFHFIGHGGFDPQRDEGFLALVGDNGRSDPLYATQLARLLRMQRSSLRLVLLNACEGARGSHLDIFSSTAATLVGDGLPAVLAMQYDITDAAAKQFSQTFYEALADNMPIETAVADARNAINLRDRLSLEWGTPVLYLRATDGQLFEVGNKQQDKETRRGGERERKAPDHVASKPVVQAEVSGKTSQRGNETSGKSAEESAQNQVAAPQKKATEATTPKVVEPPVTNQTHTPQTVKTIETSPVKLPPLLQQLGIEMIRIPAGDFLYGEDKRKTYLPEFWIAKTPITNQQYNAFVHATKHRVPRHWKNGKIPAGKEDHPVVYVSWDDAQDFCKWAGVQLPSERQCEKAARGSDGRTYPWGEKPPDRTLCNFNKNEDDTTPVDKYPAGASPYGSLDMAGNVWEWCEDWIDDRKIFRVLRGGSFYSSADGITTYERGDASPGDGLDFGGFRCVCLPSSR